MTDGQSQSASRSRRPASTSGTGARKYRAEEVRPRLEPFLANIFGKAGFDLTFEFSEAAAPHPDIENPELLIQFGGPDVDLLLANRGELLLALEQLSMEALRMPSEDHEKVCFDANQIPSATRTGPTRWIPATRERM